MTYNEMSESFGILSDCCENVEELLSTHNGVLTVNIDAEEMSERNLQRLISFGWKPSVNYEYLYLNV